MSDRNIIVLIALYFFLGELRSNALGYFSASKGYLLFYLYLFLPYFFTFLIKLVVFLPERDKCRFYMCKNL